MVRPENQVDAPSALAYAADVGTMIKNVMLSRKLSASTMLLCEMGGTWSGATLAYTASTSVSATSVGVAPNSASLSLAMVERASVGSTFTLVSVDGVLSWAYTGSVGVMVS